MNEADKATTTIPQSPAQETLAKIDKRDQRIRIIELTIVFAMVIINLFVLLRLQQVIDQNNRATIEARQQNIERQNDQKNYIKCVLLIRFNEPPVDLTTKSSVSKALDQCAQTQ